MSRPSSMKCPAPSVSTTCSPILERSWKMWTVTLKLAGDGAPAVPLITWPSIRPPPSAPTAAGSKAATSRTTIASAVARRGQIVIATVAQPRSLDRWREAPRAWPPPRARPVLRPEWPGRRPEPTAPQRVPSRLGRAAGSRHRQACRLGGQGPGQSSPDKSRDVAPPGHPRRPPGRRRLAHAIESTDSTRTRGPRSRRSTHPGAPCSGVPAKALELLASSIHVGGRLDPGSGRLLRAVRARSRGLGGWVTRQLEPVRAQPGSDQDREEPRAGKQDDQRPCPDGQAQPAPRRLGQHAIAVSLDEVGDDLVFAVTLLQLAPNDAPHLASQLGR